MMGHECKKGTVGRESLGGGDDKERVVGVNRLEV
jgi:hypothetical protein